MPIAVVVRLAHSPMPDPSITAGLPENTPVVLLTEQGELASTVAGLAPADVLVVDSDVRMPAGWAVALADAAGARTDIGTACAATHGSDLPPTRVIVGPSEAQCILITRRALTVVELRAGESVADFSRRASEHGFVHVLAGDVLVTPARHSLEPDQLAIGVSERSSHPDVVTDAPESKASAEGFVVGIDAELIDPTLTGTFEAGFAISQAVAEHPNVTAVYWIAPDGRVEALATMLASRDISSIRVSTLRDLVARGIAVDVAFRPYQDYFGRTWPRIAQYARRNIVWTLDLIANVTPTYASSPADYHRLNHTSAQAWENADAIGVLTPHVGSMLEAYQGGVPDSRIFVLPAGVPKAGGDPGGEYEDAALGSIGSRPFVLVLGNSYAHKGRAWFIRIMQRVAERGWPGAVVMVGPNPQHGSSIALEARLLSRAGEHFIVSGRVSDADRARLLSRATLTAAPSVTEGWGMTPAESVIFGSTPIASLGGGLRDITPPDAVSLLMSDDERDVDTLEVLLTDEFARAAQRQAWQRMVDRFSWDAAASILVDRMRQTLTEPRHFTSLVGMQDIAAEPVRSMKWRILDRVLPQGGAFRSAVARAVRRSA